MFRRVAVVNRGEAAMRLIHTVRDLSGRTRTPIETVALYTDEDRTAAFVREADLVHPLGPAAARPYLDHGVLERALVETGADAAWVGWGFVAEDPEFAELCDRIGVTFVGPSAAAMRRLGDKIGAKLLAERLGVPVAPWSRGEVATLEGALRAGAEIGYPLMLKAAAGGGGRGIRRVDSAADLAGVFERTRREALRAFGSDAVFLERVVTGARHVEVQLVADGQGGAWALGVRDCSVQRRNQKILEESSSVLVTPEQARALKASAVGLALAVGYRGAGTVEFLCRPGENLFAFLEVNTRLQVEHPVTEVTTGTDLVGLQLHVACGGRLAGRPPAERGHAVEARLNAEDPDLDFAPSPGRIVRLALPTGPGIRVDTGVGEGDSVPAAFDSMIAKIVAHGRDRDEALGRLRRALAETTVIIECGTTNKSFLLDLLDRPEVTDGSADTGWVDRVRAQGQLAGHRHSAVALAAAGIEAYRDEEEVDRQRLLATAHGGRPQTQHVGGRPLDLRLRGVDHQVRVHRLGRHRYRVGIRFGASFGYADVVSERFDEHRGHLFVNGHRFRLVTATHGPVHTIEVDGVNHRVSRGEGGVLRSPAPALVVATVVGVGDEIEPGAAVLVLESMKMENVVRAPFRARVRECSVTVGSQVGAGAPLMHLEPLDTTTGRATGTGEPVEIDLPSAPPTDHEVEDLRALLLGYDVDPDEIKYSVGGRARPLPGELELLTVFADLAELTRSRPGDDRTSGPSGAARSPREDFHRYLRSLDVERAGVTGTFRDRLVRVLAHYGVSDLARTPQLEDAVFRTFLAQQRLDRAVPALSQVLRRWLAGPPPGGELRVSTGVALEHLIEAAQLRFPSVSDLARGIVFRWYAQPQLRRNRAQAYAEVRADLTYLDHHPDAPDRAERIRRMVLCTQPLVRMLGQRIRRAGDRDHAPLLEVLTRRYYGNRPLSAVTTREGFVTAVQDATRIVAGAREIRDLPRAMTEIADLAADAPADGVVVDLYLAWEGQPDVDAMASRLGDLLAGQPLPATVRRVTATVANHNGAVMHHHFTFRPGPGGRPTEDRLIRGLHPQIALRLQLQRLRGFDLTRLPSTDEEMYLFKAVARNNRADERLVAMYQVRDLTALRETDGRLLALPALEEGVLLTLDAIRTLRAQHPQHERSDTNRIMVYVRPVTELPVDELEALVQRILPSASDVGLEEVQFVARRRSSGAEPAEVAVTITLDPGGGAHLHVGEPSPAPVRPLDGYRQKVLQAARRGTVHPYELTGMLGSFTEYDLTADGTLEPTDRPKGANSAAVVTGVVTTPTERHPEGITRVVLLGDPTRSLGALSAPECSRIDAALDLAASIRAPVEWFALSSGARIAMDSGTENMDRIAATLRRIIEFTQAGGEINIVVAGINVGAQPYWNAEATMLMHTKGILVMTPDGAMVLTGKQALDFSGGVSAEDNFGIGGYDRVMGPNGQAQYWAPDLPAARDILMTHYDHTYVAPGETRPRPAVTTDPADRDVCAHPHAIEGSDFTTVGQIFSATHNPDRKKAFDIRTVLRAVSDQDHPVLERWAGMADADTAVVQDAHLGGHPVCLIGIESRPLPRRGFPPTDGPGTWTAGTLFPRSSKKIARAVNAASGNRPVVVLANLSGFDGSPESLRDLQLEYGAEIGRAVVNFRGPIVLAVISRYHGGAFVVFSKALNPNLTVLALEGSFASVLGGAPAAAVVFPGEVGNRTADDPRVTGLLARAATAPAADRAALTADLAEMRATVRAEKLAEVADEFDRVHSIRRAVEVGSVDAVISPAELRPRIIDVLARAAAGSRRRPPAAEPATESSDGAEPDAAHSRSP